MRINEKRGAASPRLVFCRFQNGGVCNIFSLDTVSIAYAVSLLWDSRCGNDKKPVPTKRLEAQREGLEDVAYMNRLEKDLARLKAQGMTFAQYEKLLAERKAVIKSLSQKKVDEWRLMTGRAIDDLVRKGK